MKRIFLLVLAAGVLAVLGLVSTAAADNPALVVSPSPTFVGDQIVFSGCGYVPGASLMVQAVHNTKAVTDILQVGVTVDSSGCLSTSAFPYTVPDAGKWTANVIEQSGKKDVTINFTVGSSRLSTRTS